MLFLRPLRTLSGVLLILLFQQLQPVQSFAQKPFTCEDQFFLTLSTNPPSFNEVLIDPKTNAVVFKGINNNIPFEINAAGYCNRDNFIYCVNPLAGTLVRIDANGKVTVLIKLPLDLTLSYFAGDVTPDGRYLIILGTRYLPGGLTFAANLVRIDLEDPNYGITTIPINQAAQIFDIAFHPVTGELYGYDSSTQRLVRINPTTGVISFAFPTSGVPVNTGSLFFDAYGNLFAYGSPDFLSDQNSLYKIDATSGASTLLFKGPAAIASDGCSCPYTIELSKSVEPRTAFPCTDVEYTFEIVNTSNRPQEGIRLNDPLPPGFTFVSVSSNPLGGNVISQPGDNFFRLDGVDLPNGIFKIKIIVRVGQVSKGVYRNQAMLLNLPAALGGSRKSDDPSTPIKEDSTSITIRAFDFDTLFVNKALCEGEVSVPLDASQYVTSTAGNAVIGYSWQDGSRKSYYDADAPGQYQVTLTAGCDTAYIFYTVKYSSISVNILHNEDVSPLQLGDSLLLKASVYNTENQTTYQWTDPQPGSLRCPTCPETWVRPFNNIEYTLWVENELGCRDSASISLLVDKNKHIYFPNVFMPDSRDESNGYFYPTGDGYTRLSTFTVFSRWGERLFEGHDVAVNDMQAGWDGTFRGKPMDPGVYTWVARVSFLDGESIVYSGDVTLVR